MTRSRFLMVAVALAVLHVALSLGSLVVGFGLGMTRLDTGGNAGFVERVANGLAETLFWPGSRLWEPGMSGTLEWAIIFGNSALWGALGASIIAAIIAAGNSTKRS